MPSFNVRLLLVDFTVIDRLYSIMCQYVARINDESRKLYVSNSLARNTYNTAIRKQKALYYENSLSNSRSSKKTWTILKEAANLAKTTSKITEININGTLSSDESEIANTFNQFFSTVGSTISDSIPPSTRDPLSYCPDFPDNLRQLELEGCGPMLVGNTIQTMVSKSSTDLDGISSKLLKSVRAEIERPLAHIFIVSVSAQAYFQSS